MTHNPAQFARWLSTATDVKLENERRYLERQLGRPNAELWDQHPQWLSDFAAITNELGARRVGRNQRAAA